MLSRGYTLIELLFTLSIVAITLTIGIPSLSQQVEKAQTKNAAQRLRDALEHARSLAVFQNTRSVLIANNQRWENGWVLFPDANSNGVQDANEATIEFGDELEQVRIKASAPMNTYISFIGTGESRQIGRINGGRFMAGNIEICPRNSGEGYKLILARGGRTRTLPLSRQERGAI